MMFYKTDLHTESVLQAEVGGSPRLRLLSHRMHVLAIRFGFRLFLVFIVELKRA